MRKSVASPAKAGCGSYAPPTIASGQNQMGVRMIEEVIGDSATNTATAAYDKNSIYHILLGQKEDVGKQM